MAKSEKQKLKLLYIKEFLEKRTDDEHGVTVQDIIAHLATRDIQAERKSIYNDLSLLQDEMDLVKQKEGAETKYRVASRNFDLVELQILADSVKASKYLTEKKADNIIMKLGNLCSEYEAKGLKRSLYVPAQNISNNEKIFITLDKIEHAIVGKKQISFTYFKYNKDGVEEMVHDGARYVVSPMLLLLDDFYYLVAWDEKENKKKHFRVDRMVNAIIEETEGSVTVDAESNKTEYKNRHFNMFDGQEHDVVMAFENSLISAVFDRFGKGYTPISIDEKHFKWTERVAVCDQFFGWVASFGGKAKILGPQNVLAQYKEFLIKNLEANN